MHAITQLNKIHRIVKNFFKTFFFKT